MNMTRVAIPLLTLVLLLCFPALVLADSVNVIKNGSFEDGFALGVAAHWYTFDNGGNASYGYHDDTWDPVVYDGDYSQLLELHTKAVGGSDPDRYMGIYQVADVVSGKRYMFSFYGMVRSTEGNESESQWNYRVQVGFDTNGGTDPWAVTEWTEMSWPEYYRMDPGSFHGYAKGVTANSDKLTVFIRVWKKFPTAGEEANINIDAVSLVGPDPAAQIAATAVPELVMEEGPSLPDTGGGDVLPLVGVGLATVAVSLGGVRLAKRRG